MEIVILLETITCSCCNSNELNFLYEGKDRLHRLDGNFALFTCHNCGVVTVRPRLSNEEIQKYYPYDYISYPCPIQAETSRFKRFDRQFGVTRRRKKIEKYTKKTEGKILDIGCATGVFLKEMKDHGWEAYGVEPSNYASEIALNQLDLNVYNCYLDDVNFDDNYFDIVTLWDVFEHLPDPVRTMRIIRRILKPDGFIVITTPNTESWERKIFKQYWAGWDVPRHYNIFSDKAIDRLLKDQGMQINNLISFTGMIGAIRISLDFWLQERQISDNAMQIISKVYHSSFFRLLLYPYMLTSYLFHKSTSMTIFASKNHP